MTREDRELAWRRHLLREKKAAQIMIAIMRGEGFRDGIPESWWKPLTLICPNGHLNRRRIVCGCGLATTPIAPEAATVITKALKPATR